MKICPNCGKQFEPNKPEQKYCCPKCAQKYHKKHGKGADIEPYEFTCAKCGRLVQVTDWRDKRTRFCSKECEKRFWRHPPHEYETSTTNFRSLKDYQSWERRTNAD